MLMNILTGAFIVVCLLLTVCVLLQAKGQGWSMSFSAGSGGAYRTRRGAEKFVFNATIALGILFAVLSLVMVMLG
jgi:preprotein translocase subunit SecG